MLSIHVPVTLGLIRAETLARMKTGATIIHAAQDGIVDEATLYDALVSGKLIGAGLDVFAMEPADPGNPLFRLDRVVVTPHTAGSAIDFVAISHGTPSPTCNPSRAGTPLPPGDVIGPPPEENE